MDSAGTWFGSLAPVVREDRPGTRAQRDRGRLAVGDVHRDGGTARRGAGPDLSSVALGTRRAGRAVRQNGGGQDVAGVSRGTSRVDDPEVVVGDGVTVRVPGHPVDVGDVGVRRVRVLVRQAADRARGRVVLGRRRGRRGRGGERHDCLAGSVVRHLLLTVDVELRGHLHEEGAVVVERVGRTDGARRGVRLAAVSPVDGRVLEGGATGLGGGEGVDPDRAAVTLDQAEREALVVGGRDRRRRRRHDRDHDAVRLDPALDLDLVVDLHRSPGADVAVRDGLREGLREHLLAVVDGELRASADPPGGAGRRDDLGRELDLDLPLALGLGVAGRCLLLELPSVRLAGLDRHLLGEEGSLRADDDRLHRGGGAVTGRLEVDVLRLHLRGVGVDAVGGSSEGRQAQRGDSEGHGGPGEHVHGVSPDSGFAALPARCCADR